MAQFGFENDIQNIMKLDMPITNAPMPRWQRKASGSAPLSSNSSLTPGKSGNKSQSLSKTLSKRPNKTPGKNVKSTPSKAGGDRFIPTRNSKQMDVASFLLTKENEPMDTNESTATAENRKAWSVTLNGCNIEEAKILHFGGKPLNAPEGYQNNKKTRYISSVPDRILEAPDLKNDFYLNLLDWSKQNTLAVALHDSVYLWNDTAGDITQLMKMENSEEYISSLSFSKEGHYLAVGTSDCKVDLWDVASEKRLRTMGGHSARVGSMCWNEHVVTSGSRSGHIHHDDVRMPQHNIASLVAHTQEVCGLTWSPDGRYLASGGNDYMVYVWPGLAESSVEGTQPIRAFSEHTGAVKALAWCPWKSNILASGGGTSDGCIRVWNVNCGSCISCLDTQSEISSLVFAPNYKELVSGHGYAHNNVVIWKYPSFSKVMELNGHKDRVLNLIANPDCSAIASVAGDEIRLWKCFELAKDKSTSGVISHHTIR